VKANNAKWRASVGQRDGGEVCSRSEEPWHRVSFVQLCRERNWRYNQNWAGDNHEDYTRADPAQNVGPLNIRRNWKLIIPLYLLPLDRTIEQRPTLLSTTGGRVHVSAGHRSLSLYLYTALCSLCCETPGLPLFNTGTAGTMSAGFHILSSCPWLWGRVKTETTDQTPGVTQSTLAQTCSVAQPELILMNDLVQAKQPVWSVFESNHLLPICLFT